MCAGEGVDRIRDKVWLLTGNLLGDPSELRNADQLGCFSLHLSQQKQHFPRSLISMKTSLASENFQLWLCDHCCLSGNRRTLKASALRFCNFALVSPLKVSASWRCHESAHLSTAGVLVTAVHPGKHSQPRNWTLFRLRVLIISAGNQAQKPAVARVARLIPNHVSLMLGHKRSETEGFPASASSSQPQTIGSGKGADVRSHAGTSGLRSRWMDEVDFGRKCCTFVFLCFSALCLLRPPLNMIRGGRSWWGAEGSGNNTGHEAKSRA